MIKDIFVERGSQKFHRKQRWVHLVFHISITVPDVIYQEYIEGIQGNRSAYIWGNMVKGIQSEQGDLENNKAKISNLLKELHNSQEQIKKLNLLNESLKAKLDHETEEDKRMRKAEALSDALTASGFMDTAGMPSNDPKRKKDRVILE